LLKKYKSPRIGRVINKKKDSLASQNYTDVRCGNHQKKRIEPNSVARVDQ